MHQSTQVLKEYSDKSLALRKYLSSFGVGQGMADMIINEIVREPYFELVEIYQALEQMQRIYCNCLPRIKEEIRKGIEKSIMSWYNEVPNR